jgi:hypothetical protein
MRFAPGKRTLFNHQPFDGDGESLYVTVGNVVQYRNLRLIHGQILRGVEFNCGAASVLKTARVAFDTSPVSSIVVPIDSDWLGETVSIDVRTFRDDVENETDNSRILTMTLDGSGDEVSEIRGTATLLSTEARDGGIVRIRFLWEPAADGTQPDTFTAIRTAGPTSPANATATVDPGVRQLIEIDTPALSDASPYTYKIQASLLLVTLDVLTGIIFTADATGPVAPTVATAEAW